MRKYHIEVREFRDVDDLNYFLEDIPGDDIIQVYLQPGLLAVSYKFYEEADSTEPETSKKMLVENKSTVIQEYEQPLIDQLISLVEYLGMENCVEMLQFLRNHRICTSACLARMLDEASTNAK